MAALTARSPLTPFACHAPQRPAFRPALSAKHARGRIVRADAAAGVTDETFEAEVIKAPVPVLIDFWAPWCGPCRMIAPLIDEIAEEYKGRVKCVKLNTDESPNTASELGIRSIPTVIIYKDGKKCETIIGAVPKSTLVSALEKFL